MREKIEFLKRKVLRNPYFAAVAIPALIVAILLVVILVAPEDTTFVYINF